MKKLFASLLIGLTAGMFVASAGDNTSLPFTDTFELYTNGTPLIDGTNGWYGSSSSIIVSSNTTIAPAGSTNLALIPVDCTLSNRFSGFSATNVWITLDMRPSLYDGTNPPTVDTNVAGMFYVNTNGNFVLHNGPVTNGNPTNSSSWMTNTSFSVGTNGTTWVRIGIMEDFNAKTWKFYANNTLLNSGVGFINTNLTNFAGFDLYNGATTSYIDNVYISATQPGIIGVSPTSTTFSSTYTTSTSNQTFTAVITNVSQTAVTFSNTPSISWLTFSPLTGTVDAGGSQVLTGTVDSASLAVGTYVVTNTITSDATNSPKLIVVTLTVSKANQATITFAPTSPQIYNTTQGLSASGGSGSGAFSFAVTNGPGSIASTSNLTATSGTGMIWVVATKADDGNYYAASASASVAAEKATQSALTFNPTTPQTYNTMQTLSASGGESAGVFSYSIESGSGFTLSVANLTATNGTGSVSVRATKAGDDYYLATSADRTINAQKATQGSISFSPATPQTYNTTQSLSASGGSGSGAFSFAVTNGPGSISSTSNLLATSGTGIIWVVATKADDGNYNAASASASVAAEKVTQTITFAEILAQPLANVTLTLTASASSGLGISYTLDSGTGSISSNVLTFSAAGSKTVRASQAGNDNYSAATDVSRTFGVYGSSPVTNTVIPWSDNFEGYFNAEPLINGTNGWYGSSASIIIQTNTVSPGGSTKAALIPVDCTLSNKFANIPSSNVYLQMDIRPSLYDGTNGPAVDTNVPVMFYVNSNGNFVVHNGDPAVVGTNWVAVTSFNVGTNGTTWVKVGIFEDFTAHKWSLYAKTNMAGDNVLVTNNIGFINTTLNSFVGFDVYNGAQTSYLDNVSVDYGSSGGIGLSTTVMAFTSTYGSLPSPAFKTSTLSNVGQQNINYNNALTYGSSNGWLTMLPASGTLNAGAGQVLTGTVTLATLPVGTYYATNTVTAADATNSPQTVVVSLAVSKATPTVTSWGTATAIVTGQAFSNSVLSGVIATNTALGVDVPGTNTFDSPGTVPTTAGVYSVAVTFTPSDTANYNVVAGSVNVTVNTSLAITNQPVSRTNAPGTTASFTVGASGDGPLYYQWRKGGADIGSANSATYSFTVLTNSAGGYDCLVSNASASVTSDVASLTLIFSYTNDTTITGDLTCTSPLVVAPGVKLTVTGKLTIFGASTVGAGSTLIVGTLDIPAGSSLTVTGGSLTVAGATIEGTFTLDDSRGTLTILDDFIVDGGTNIWTDSHIVVSNATKNVTIEAKNGAVFMVSNCLIEAASGSSNFAFIARNGTTFSMTDTTNRNCGFASDNSTNWGLYIDTPNAVLQRNVFTNNYMGVVFGPNAAGGAINQSKIYGNTSLTNLDNSGTSTNDARSNWWGTAVSSEIAAKLAGNVNYYPWYTDENMTQLVAQVVITQDPASITTNVGDSAVFTVTATGTAPLYYQWQKNGANMGGETSATLTIDPVNGPAAGNYRCIVSNAINVVTSAPATLTVNFMVMAVDQIKAQGAANPTLTYIIAYPDGNQVWSEDLPVDLSNTNTVTMTTTATNDSPVGAYPITINKGSIAAANCTFTEVNGLLGVSLAIHSNVYGYYVMSNATQIITNSISFEYPTNASLGSLGWTLSLPAGWILTNAAGPGNPEVQTNTIVWSGASMPTNNPLVVTYTVELPVNQTGVFSVAASSAVKWGTMKQDAYTQPQTDPLPIKMLLTVTPDAGQSKVYGASDPTFTYTITKGSLLSGDSMTGSLSRVSGETVANSPYAINIGTLGAGANYVITLESASFAITPKGITVDGITDNKTFDGTTLGNLSFASAVLVGTNGGDAVSLNTSSATVSDYASKTVGVYTVTVSNLALSGADAGNYSLPSTKVLNNATISAKEISVDGITDNKTFDGTTLGNLSFATAVLVGTNGGDAVSLNTSSATVSDYASKTVGVYTVTVSNLALSGADAGNYSLPSTKVLNNATISAKEISVDGITDNKTFDGTTLGNLSFASAVLVGTNGGDAVSLNTSSATVSDYASKTVGVYTVTVSNLALSGADAGNYSLPSTKVLNNATISAKEISVDGITDNKTFDGTTLGNLSFASAVLVGTNGGDAVSLNTSSATVSDYASKTVGVYTVTVSNLALSGADAGNYSLPSTKVLNNATISAKEISVDGITDNKTFDGTTLGNLSFASAVLVGTNGGDAVSLNFSSATVSDYASKTVGVYTVTVSNLALSGADAGNYSLPSTKVLNNATISAKAITVDGITDNKTFDGTTLGNLSFASAVLVGTNGGDAVSLNTSSATVSDYASKTVGVYTVTVSNLALSGADAGNYSLPSTKVLNNATISAKEISVDGITDNKTFDGTTLGNLSFASAVLVGTNGGDAVSLNFSSATVSDYASKTVGVYTVTVSNLALSGADAGNYSLPSTKVLNNATISAKAITVDGITDNKTFDGTTLGNLSFASAVLVGTNGGDAVSLNTSSATVSDYASKTVGVYTVTVSNLALSGADAGNYSLPSTKVLNNATISAKEISVDGITDNKTFDGTTLGNLSFASAVLVGTNGGDAVSLNTSSATVSDYASKTVGVYTVTVSNLALSGADAGNYSLPSTKVLNNATISAKEISVDGITDNKTFDGTTLGNLSFASAVLVGTNGGDAVSLNFSSATVSDYASKTVGVYTVTVSNLALSGADAGNYSLPSTKVLNNATISAKAITVDGITDNKTFDGTTLGNLSFASAVLVGTNGGDAVSLNTSSATVSDYASKTVGVYTVTVSNLALSGADAGNYSLPSTKVLNNATISAKEISVDGITDNKTFDGTTLGNLSFASAVLVGTNGGDAVSLNFSSATVSDYASKTVGVYTVTVSNLALSGADAGNYSLPSTKVLNNATISAKEISVDGITDNKTFDGTTLGNLSFASAVLVGTNGGDAVSLNFSSATVSDYASKTVGVYTVTVSNLALSGADAGNYSLPSTKVLNNATISAKEISVDGITDNKTFDGTTLGNLSFASAVLVGTNGGDAVSLNTSSATVSDYASKTVGVYTVTVSNLALSGADAGNYSLPSTKVLNNATISAKEISVDGITDNKTFDGTTLGNLSFATAVLVGTNGGDAVSLNFSSATVSDYASKTVGVYTVTVSNLALSGADAGNYSLPSTKVLNNATISAKGITVDGITDNKTYDGTTLGNLSFASAVLVGTNGGDAVSLNTSSATVSDYASKTVGVYTVTVSNLALSGADAGNYSLPSTKVLTNATISAAALTITANNTNKSYGATVTFAGTEFTTNVMFSSDVVTNVMLSSAGATNTASVNTYAIIPTNATGTGLENYTITYSNGTLTVTGAVLTITADNDSKTYGQTKSYGSGQTAFSSIGLQNGETIGSVTITASGGTAANDSIGTYGLTPSAATPGTFTPGNYYITYLPGTLTVNVLPVYLTGTRPFDGSATADYSILSVSNKVSGDTVNVVSGTALLAGSDVGSQLITNMNTLVLGGAQWTNYTLSGASGVVEITQSIAATGTHTCVGYYSPSVSMVVSNSFGYPTNLTLTNLVWSPILPTGWTVLSAAGSNAVLSGTNVTFTAIPTNNPVLFTYTVRVPGNAAVSNTLNASVSYTYASGSPQSKAVDAIAIYRYHSADYRSPKRQIDMVEIVRLLSYWRTGFYAPSTIGNDGYASATSLYKGSTNAGIHSANYKTNKWRIDSDEANRVLSYWRAGGYHVDPAGLDGYAPTNSGVGPAAAWFSGAMISGVDLGAMVSQSGPATYTAGQSLTVTCTFNPGADSLLGLVWKPQVPAGWTITAVSGDSSPELVRGEALCVGSIPATPITLTYTVKVPATETKAGTLTMVASYFANGMVNPALLSATPIVINNAATAALVDNPFSGSDISLLKGVVNADFDGDRKADPSIYDESTGAWVVKFSAVTVGKENQVVANASLGGIGWAPAAADYDGDGITDPAIYQESTGNWSVKLSGNGYAQVDLAGFLGGAGWASAAADYDGDGLADPAVYQEATGDWKVKLSSADYAETAVVNLLGSQGYSVVSADYDGDGIADAAVYDRATGTWAMILSSGDNSAVTVLPEFLGGKDWIAVPGDYDGDGFADPAVFNPATGKWIQKLSGNGYVSATVPAVFGSN